MPSLPILNATALFPTLYYSRDQSQLHGAGARNEYGITQAGEVLSAKCRKYFH